MGILKVMLKYAGYYILVMVLLSIFAPDTVKTILLTICGAALSVSMFAAVIQLILGEGGGVGAVVYKISTWCLRGTIIITAISVIAGIGLGNIAKIFG